MYFSVSAAPNFMHYTDFPNRLCMPQRVQIHILCWPTLQILPMGLGRSFKLPIYKGQTLVYNSFYGKIFH